MISRNMLTNIFDTAKWKISELKSRLEKLTRIQYRGEEMVI